jgi:type III secretory pathway component EscT
LDGLAERLGVDLPALGLAWARALPTVTIVPAFGLKAVPTPVRPAMALALAASVYPALAPAAHSPTAASWLVAAVGEVLRGLPVAVAAAVPLWAATMAGGLADALRGAADTVDAPTVEGRATPFGVLLSLFACASFLSTGGPATVATILARSPADAGGFGWATTADGIVSGIALALAVGAPLIGASIVIELATALVSRATAPTQVAAMVAPLRTVGILALFALLLGRTVGMLQRP